MRIELPKKSTFEVWGVHDGDAPVPYPSSLDFFLGHRYCTYDNLARPVLHTDSRKSAMESGEPWVYDWPKKKWIKRLTAAEVGA